MFCRCVCQILDGLSSGIYAVLCVLVTEDLTRGSGRFNFVFGLVGSLCHSAALPSCHLTDYLFVYLRRLFVSLVLCVYIFMCKYIYVYMYVCIYLYKCFWGR